MDKIEHLLHNLALLWMDVINDKYQINYNLSLDEFLIETTNVLNNEDKIFGESILKLFNKI